MGITPGHTSDELIIARVDRNWFWAQIPVGDPSVCWLWTGDRTSRGYGIVRFSHEDRQYRAGAHRVAYLLGTGRPLGDLRALHHCDNPPCCNHQTCLWAGTQGDNIRDAASKGRRGRATLSQKIEVARRHRAGERMAALASEFGVSATAVGTWIRQVRLLGDSNKDRLVFKSAALDPNRTTGISPVVSDKLGISDSLQGPNPASPTRPQQDFGP